MRLRPDHPRINHLLQTSRAVFGLQTRPYRPEARVGLTTASAPHRPGTLATPARWCVHAPSPASWWWRC